jgi:hypothetical protein
MPVTGMPTVRRRGALALLMAGMALAGIDTARAACIDESLAHAARLHEFEMLMMNVSLRCSLMGVDMRPHYEAMVAAHQAQFDSAAQRLQHYFATTGAPETRHGGLYDRYATLIANRYGGGNTSLDSCRIFDSVAVEVTRAAPDNGRTLSAVAQAMVEHPVLERATCVVP